MFYECHIMSFICHQVIQYRTMYLFVYACLFVWKLSVWHDTGYTAWRWALVKWLVTLATPPYTPLSLDLVLVLSPYIRV